VTHDHDHEPRWPIRLWDVEAPTFSRQSVHRWSVPFTPVRFLVLISVKVGPTAIVQLEGLGHLKSPMTSLWIEPATFRHWLTIIFCYLSEWEPCGKFFALHEWVNFTLRELYPCRRLDGPLSRSGRSCPCVQPGARRYTVIIPQVHRRVVTEWEIRQPVRILAGQNSG
jgi:hypothetical protein